MTAAAEVAYESSGTGSCGNPAAAAEVGKAVIVTTWASELIVWTAPAGISTRAPAPAFTGGCARPPSTSMAPVRM